MILLFVHSTFAGLTTLKTTLVPISLAKVLKFSKHYYSYFSQSITSRTIDCIKLDFVVAVPLYMQFHGRVFDSGHKLSFCYSCNRRIETEISQATVTSEVLNEFFIMFIHLQLYNTKSRVDHRWSRDFSFPALFSVADVLQPPAKKAKTWWFCYSGRHHIFAWFGIYRNSHKY